MRNLYLLLVLLLGAVGLFHPQVAQAQGDAVNINTTHYNSFDYTPGNLAGQAEPWWWGLESASSLSQSNRVKVGDEILVTSGSLNYPGLTSLGNKITVTGNTDSYFMRLTGVGTAGTDIYASFILRITALPGDSEDGNHFISLGNNTNNFGLVYIRDSQTEAGKFNIGIRKRDGSATVWAPDELDVNTSHYIVFGAEKGTGAPTRGDIANLWVNPTQTTSAPIPSASSSEGSDFGNFTGISWVILHRAADNTNTSMIAEIDEFRLDKNWTNVAPLPVSFNKFSAEAQENRVKLAWSTFSEQNNSHFEVERSLDGVTFNLLTTVDGRGSTSEPSSYSVFDNNPQSGVNYYRLSQVDNDGKRTVLSIVSAVIQLDNAVTISAYLNPVSSEINLFVNNYQGNLRATLSAIDGRVIHQQEMEAKAGQSVYLLSLKVKPAAGIYVLQITGDNGLTKSVKILIP